MAWNLPSLPAVGSIATVANWATKVIDSLRYLKGLDGVPTIESGLTIDNTDGDERLLLPLLSTAECSTVLNAEGEVAFDEQTHQMKAYDGTAVRAIISEADVDDTPVNGATTDPVSSNWAYDYANIITTAGDLRYCTSAGVDTRLGVGTIGHILSVAAGGTTPEWRAETARTNKLQVETRALDAANGDVAYTGYGFQPTSLIAFSAYGGQLASIGVADVNLSEQCLAKNTAAAGWTEHAALIYMYNATPAGASAVLKTLDADGFTLTWTKGTNVALTVNITVLAMR